MKDPRQIPRQPSLQPIVLPIDEEIQNAFDSDDEITLTAWHPRVHRRTKKIYSDAHDSGYTSEGSMYSDETNDGSSFTSASSRKEPVKAGMMFCLLEKKFPLLSYESSKTHLSSGVENLQTRIFWSDKHEHFDFRNHQLSVSGAPSSMVTCKHDERLSRLLQEELH